MAAARDLNHAYVGTEHLLLGLIDEKKGIAAGILRSFNIVGNNAREEVVRILGPARESEEARESEPSTGSFTERVTRRVLRRSVGARSGFNFTSRLRRVLAEARTIAADMRHPSVGPEHILLSIVRESEVAESPQGSAIQALARCGVDPAALRAAVVAQLRPGTGEARQDHELPYTTAAKSTMEFAFAEARLHAHAHIGTEHLLLGLLREATSIAAQVMQAQGLTLTGLRAAIEIGGPVTGEIEADGANLVVTDAADAQSKPPPGTGFARAYRYQSAPDLSERLTGILSSAHVIAGEYGSEQVEPIHVALALVTSDEGAAHAVLELLRCDRGSLSHDLRELAQRSAEQPKPERRITLGADTERLLAVAEQRRSKANHVGSDHLLVALLDEPSEIMGLFAKHGVTADAVRELVRRITG